MKYAFCVCLVVAQLFCFSLRSQSYFSSGANPEPELLWEIGGSAGVMNCLTDIGGKSGPGKKFINDINWNKTQLCGSLFVNACWQSKVSLRVEASFGQLSGSDDVLKTTTDAARSRYLRNLHFKTGILELALITELYPLTIISPNRQPQLISLYLLGGIGFFNYNPQAMINNTWVDLRPLRTEGEGFKEYPGRTEYKSVSWCIPVGAGIRFDPSGLINMRFEIAYRITGTDYLDDVSNNYVDPALFGKYLSATNASLSRQLADRSMELTGGIKNNNNAVRGNPANKDAYFSCMLKLSIVLGRGQRK